MKTGSYTEPCKCHTCVRTASYMCAYSIIHVCVTFWRTLSYLRRDFFFAGATFFCWRDFSLLVRLSFAGATFFRWRDCIFVGATFFLLVRLSFAGTTFFRWRDFFLKRSFVERC